MYFQEDQTYPRQTLQIDVPIKAQETEVATPAIISTQIEKNLHTSNKSERRKYIIIEWFKRKIFPLVD